MLIILITFHGGNMPPSLIALNKNRLFVFFSIDTFHRVRVSLVSIPSKLFLSIISLSISLLNIIINWIYGVSKLSMISRSFAKSISVIIIILRRTPSESCIPREGFSSIKLAIMIKRIFEVFLFRFDFSLLIISSIAAFGRQNFPSTPKNLNFSRIDNLWNSISFIFSTTTRIARLFNRHVFIMINWDVIDNRLRDSYWNLISYLIRNNVSLYCLWSRNLSRLDNRFVSSFLSRSLLELNLHSFLINSWSSNILFIVNISWNVNGLWTWPALINRISCNRLSVNNTILLLIPV